MKKLSPRYELTVARVRETISYDPVSGVFVWLPKAGHNHESHRWNTRYEGKQAGHVVKGYRRICIDEIRVQASHIAYVLMKGEWPANEIDHVDLDGANDRWANLRPATKAENSRNRKLRMDSKTGFKGVRYVARGNKRWRARITLPTGKRIDLGSFATSAEASAAYQAAAVEHHGDFARQ